MKALFDSFVRTVVPLIVGAVIGWFVAAGITLDKEFESALTLVLMGVFQALYYLAVRLLEMYVNPRFGWLLGIAKPPVYDKQAVEDDALVRLSTLDLDEQNADVQAATARAMLRRDLR